jgi:DNA-nicking Smr family endonuclease
MNYQEKYEQLLAEFEQYKRESIKWSVEDFIDLEDDYDITQEQAQQALEEMIDKHDCNHGITWYDVEYFKQLYGIPKNNKP